MYAKARNSRKHLEDVIGKCNVSMIERLLNVAIAGVKETDVDMSYAADSIRRLAQRPTDLVSMRAVVEQKTDDAGDLPEWVKTLKKVAEAAASKICDLSFKASEIDPVEASRRSINSWIDESLSIDIPDIGISIRSAVIRTKIDWSRADVSEDRYLPYEASAWKAILDKIEAALLNNKIYMLDSEVLVLHPSVLNPSESDLLGLAWEAALVTVSKI